MAMTGGTSKLVKTSELGDTGATIKLYVYYKTSQSVSTNKSTISCGMYFVISEGAYIDAWTDNGGSYVGKSSLTFNGKPTATRGTVWLAENKEFSVTHNADGTGSATIAWKWGVNSSWADMVYPSGSFTITLPTIARKSSVSASNANIGSKPTITISRKSSDFTHTLQYKINGESSYTTIVSKTTSTSYSSWVIPDTAYNYISSGKVTITIKCITYSGSTKIGEATTTLTATATAASTVSATNAYIGNATTISISRKSSKLTHTLQYKIGSQSSYTTLVSKTTSTSYKWTIPESAYNYISSGKVTITINCITYSDGVKIGSKTTTLTASQKGASTVTATSAYIGSKSTITLSRYSSNFKHTLQYKISGQDSYTTIVSKTTNTSQSWTIPTSAYNYVSKTSKTVSITINCITYYGDVNLGSKTTTLTATCVEADCKPTLAPTVIDNGSVSTKLTGDGNNIVIKGYNSMKYTIGATAKNGATIKSQKVTCGSKSSTEASGTLSHVESNKFVFTATDTRGFSSSTTITKKTLINFVKLTCALNAKAELATDSNGNSTTTLTIKASGNWFNGSFGAVTNTLTVQYRYKTNSGSYGSWTSITPTKSGNTYTATKTITGLGYKNSYTVEVRAYDELHNQGSTGGIITPSAKTVKAQPLFDWGENDFNFNVNVVMDNTTRIYGKKADGSAWVQALEPCNANNNLTLGFGGYDASLGNTNVYGNSVNVNSKNNINLNSPVKLVKDTYSSACAMDCQNSDIWGVNGIIFADKCNGVSEGIKFPTDDSSGTYDRLAAFDGNLYFYPKDSSTGYALFYTAGMKYTLNGAITFWGHLTTSSTEIFAFIPTSRRILASNVSVSGKIIMRGVSGYLYNPKDTSTNVINLSSPSGFTKTVAVKDGGIYLKLTFDNKILNGNGNTYTNNTPVIFCNTGGDLVFTFS